MHEWSVLSAHELIEPEWASTSQAGSGTAAIVRMRSMSAPASPSAAKKAVEEDRMQIWPKLPASMVSGATVSAGRCQRRCGGHMTTYKTVVVGTDGSESSLLAVDRAGKIAADSNAKLIIATGYLPEKDDLRAADALGKEGYKVSGNAT